MTADEVARSFFELAQREQPTIPLEVWLSQFVDLGHECDAAHIVARSLNEALMAKKTNKRTVMKAHKIARKVAKRSGVRNPFAVGMAVAKKAAAKRKRSRR